MAESMKVNIKSVLNEVYVQGDLLEDGAYVHINTAGVLVDPIPVINRARKAHVILNEFRGKNKVLKKIPFNLIKELW